MPDDGDGGNGVVVTTAGLWLESARKLHTRGGGRGCRGWLRLLTWGLCALLAMGAL